jgi:DNA-binding transcriptional MerR regulator
MLMSMGTYLLSISEAAKRLNRTPRCLREWERATGSGPRLPENLRPQRNSRGDRRYSEELVEHIREWMIANDLRLGANIERARAAKNA